MSSTHQPEFPGDEPDPCAFRSQLRPRDLCRATDVVRFDLGCILGATWPVYRQRLGLCLGVCGTVLVLTVATRGAAASAGSRAAFVGLRWLVPIALLWLFVAFLVESV